jgi:hypothetical protein
MNNPDPNGMDTPEQELSPEARAALAKARRSFGISMGILLAGFMAIGLALVYRITRDAPPAQPEAPQLAAELSLPAGAQILSALVSDGVVNVTYRLDTNTVLALFDPETGELTATVQIVTE